MSIAIATTMDALRAKISKSSNASPLAAKKVTLLAASKGQPAPLIIKAIEAGITDFGENRVQDACDKWPALRQAYPRLRLHLIGKLQTNKVKQALELFDVIQTIDRSKLAEAIAKVRTAGQSSLITRHFYIQVNTGNEPQKAGVIPEEADTLIDYCIKELHLPVIGLMCVPPHDQPPSPHFALLRQIAQRHGLPEFSMGMSDDFETAIRMGSTCVRIGRALFGDDSV